MVILYAMYVLSALASVTALQSMSPNSVSIGLIFPLTKAANATITTNVSKSYVRNDHGSLLLTSALMAISDVNSNRVELGGMTILPNTTLKYRIVDTRSDEKVAVFNTLSALFETTSPGSFSGIITESAEIDLTSAVIPDIHAGSSLNLLNSFGIPHISGSYRLNSSDNESPLPLYVPQYLNLQIETKTFHISQSTLYDADALLKTMQSFQWRRCALVLDMNVTPSGNQTDRGDYRNIYAKRVASTFVHIANSAGIQSTIIDSTAATEAIVEESSNNTIFLMLCSAVQVASFLKSLYFSNESGDNGTQNLRYDEYVFLGLSSITGSAEEIQEKLNNESTHSQRVLPIQEILIMRGFLGIRNALPHENGVNKDIKVRDISERFSKQSPTMVKSLHYCSNATDSFNNQIWIQPRFANISSNDSICVGHETFPSLLNDDLSTSTDIGLQLSYMYDSVIALAAAYHQEIHNSSSLSFSANSSPLYYKSQADLRDSIYKQLGTLSFQGMTGMVGFSQKPVGLSTDPVITNTINLGDTSFYGMVGTQDGDRDVGLTYVITNFNGSMENTVAEWSRERGVTCRESLFENISVLRNTHELVWNNGMTASCSSSNNFRGNASMEDNGDSFSAWIGYIPNDTLLVPCTYGRDFTTVISRHTSDTQCDTNNERKVIHTLTVHATNDINNSAVLGCCNIISHPSSEHCISGLLIPHTESSSSYNPVPTTLITTEQCTHVGRGSLVAIMFSVFAGCIMAIQLFFILLVAIYRRHPLIVTAKPGAIVVLACASAIGMSTIVVYPGSFTVEDCRAIPILLSLSLSLSLLPGTILLWHANYKNNLLAASTSIAAVSGGNGHSDTEMAGRLDLIRHTRNIRVTPIMIFLFDAIITFMYSTFTFDEEIAWNHSVADLYSRNHNDFSKVCRHNKGSAISMLFIFMKLSMLLFSLCHVQMSLKIKGIEERKKLWWCRAIVYNATTFSIFCLVVILNDGFVSSPESNLGNSVSRYIIFSVVVSTTFILFTYFAYSAVVSKLYHGYVSKGSVAKFGTMIISHRIDVAFARRLDKKLIANGFSNWLASRCADVDDELEIFQKTLNAMDNVSHVILVLSESSILSRSCLRLLNEAYELEKNIQPVMCNECYVERGAIRMMLLRKSIVDFTRTSFSRASAELMAQLSSSVEEQETKGIVDDQNEDDGIDSRGTGNSRKELRRQYMMKKMQKSSFRRHLKTGMHEAANMESGDNASNIAFARLYMGYRVGVAAFILVILSSIALFILGQHSSRYNQSLTSLATNIAGAVAALMYCLFELTNVFSSHETNEVTRFVFQKKISLHILASSLNIVSFIFKTTEVYDDVDESVSGAMIAADLVWTTLATIYNLLTLITLLQLNINNFLKLFKKEDYETRVQRARRRSSSGVDSRELQKRLGALLVDNKEANEDMRSNRVNTDSKDDVDENKKQSPINIQLVPEDKSSMMDSMDEEVQPPVAIVNRDSGMADADSILIDVIDSESNSCKLSGKSSQRIEETNNSGLNMSAKMDDQNHNPNTVARSSLSSTLSSPKEIIHFINRERSSSENNQTKIESQQLEISKEETKIDLLVESGSSEYERHHQQVYNPDEDSSANTDKHLSETENNKDSKIAPISSDPAESANFAEMATSGDEPDISQSLITTPGVTPAQTAGLTPTYTITPGLTPGMTPRFTPSIGNTSMTNTPALDNEHSMPLTPYVDTYSRASGVNSTSAPMTPTNQYSGSATPIPFSAATYDCFISYKHDDFGKAQILQNQLEKLGYRVWIDTLIKPGEMWRESIARALEDVDIVLFLMTAEALNSRYCEEEILYSFELGIEIQPLVAGDDVFNTLNQKPVLKAILSPIQFIQFVNVPIAESLAVIDVRMKNIQQRKTRDNIRLARRSSSNKRRGSFLNLANKLMQLPENDSKKTKGLSTKSISEFFGRASTSFSRDTFTAKSLTETGKLWFFGHTEDTLQASKIANRVKRM